MGDAECQADFTSRYLRSSSLAGSEVLATGNPKLFCAGMAAANWCRFLHAGSGGGLFLRYFWRAWGVSGCCCRPCCAGIDR